MFQASSPEAPPPPSSLEWTVVWEPGRCLAGALDTACWWRGDLDVWPHQAAFKLDVGMNWWYKDPSHRLCWPFDSTMSVGRKDVMWHMDLLSTMHIPHEYP